MGERVTQPLASGCGDFLDPDFRPPERAFREIASPHETDAPRKNALWATQASMDREPQPVHPLVGTDIRVFKRQQSKMRSWSQLMPCSDSIPLADVVVVVTE